jgi:hypothetical protein
MRQKLPARLALLRHDSNQRTDMPKLFDVIEVEFKKPHKVRLIDTKKTEKNAEAIVSMAVMRRGVEDSFFTTAPAGKFKDGDHMPQSK